MLKKLLQTAFLFSVPAAATECPPQLRTFKLFERQSTAPSCIDQWQQAFFRDLGCPVTFIEGNPGLAVREQKLQAGEIEIITGLAKSSSRTFRFSLPIGRNNVYFYRRLQDSRWDQIKTWCDPVMQQARILIPAQGYFGEAMQQLRQYPNCSRGLVPVNHSTARPFDMLDKGRADLLISSERHLAALTPEQQKHYQKLALTVVEGDVHIAYSAQVPAAFIERVDQWIAARQQEPVAVSPQGKVCLLPLKPNVNKP